MFRGAELLANHIREQEAVGYERAHHTPGEQGTGGGEAESGAAYEKL